VLENSIHFFLEPGMLFYLKKYGNGNSWNIIWVFKVIDSAVFVFKEPKYLLNKLLLLKYHCWQLLE